MRVGTAVTRSVGSTMHRQARLDRAHVVDRRLRVGRVLAERLQQRARLGHDVEVGLALAEPGEHRRELEQRVVAGAGERGVAGDAARGHAEAERALLGAADGVQPAVAVGHDRAAALVDQPVHARDVGPLLGQPLGAEPAADLLVDHRDHLQLAARGPPAAARQRGGGDDLGGGLATSCRACRGPTGGRRGSRPTRGRASSRRDRRARCPRATGSPEPARVRPPQARRRGSGARARRPSARPRAPPRAGSAASHSWHSRSFPGGLTVLKRISRARTSAVSSCSAAIVADDASRTQLECLEARVGSSVAGAVEPGLVAVELEAHVGGAAERVELVGDLLGVGRRGRDGPPPAPP